MTGFYATEPKATELLLEKETFNRNILEPCAGMGHIRDVLVYNGYNVIATDLIYRGVDDIKQEDVFNIKEFNGDSITNPPFSLWRQLVHLLLLHDKKFLLIGNKTALIYRELFYQIRDNKVWFGYTVPKEFITTDGLTKKISGLCRWYTNIEPRPMIEPIKLVKFEPLEHKEYTNYNAVNVDDIKQIPSTNEIIGVPITFIEKYDINQFKIVGIDRLPYSIELGIGEMGKQWCNDFFSLGNKGHYTPTMRNLCLYENGQAKIRFSRILIQRKKDCEK